VLQLRGAAGIALLDRWLAWAQRCRIDAFVKLGRTIHETGRHNPEVGVIGPVQPPVRAGDVGQLGGLPDGPEFES
jgi:hypothetical protein